MKSFVQAIQNEEQGFVIKNSVFLPFHCEILSIWIGKEMSLLSSPDLVTDLADTEIIGIREGETYTNLVFRKWGDLAKELGNHKGHIILRAAEKGSDIFKIENLHYIRIRFNDSKRDISFEIIDDPYNL
ncbi:MAG: hypothetical protein HGA72_09080 [Chlorobiaceae bacterium]|jgi:hypothetical protein|nr:hypothetical protein [Chlorobiaceae bacterium]